MSPAHKRRKISSPSDDDEEPAAPPPTGQERWHTAKAKVREEARVRRRMTLTKMEMEKEEREEMEMERKRARELDVFDDIEGGNLGREKEEMERKVIKRTKERELDVFDDIEGGNLGREPPGRLDRRGVVGEGFFKRFHGPRVGEREREMAREREEEREKERENMDVVGTAGVVAAAALVIYRDELESSDSDEGDESEGEEEEEEDESEVSESEEEDDQVSEAMTPNAGKTVKNAKEDGDEFEVPESEEEADQASEAMTPNAGKTAKKAKENGVWKGYVLGKPKKTFEDEIKELEAKARNEAHNSGSEDELAANVKQPRSSARKPPPRAVAANAKALSSPVRKPSKPLEKRKAMKAVVPPKPAAVLNKEDTMEIDQMEEEEEEAVPTPSKAAAIPSQSVPKASTPKKSVGRPPKRAKQSDDTTFDLETLRYVRKVLMEKTNGKRPIPLQNLEEEYAKVYSVINQTVTAGESNSMLLIGARGSGKSALVNHVLREQTLEHPDDFHAVRLNGFIHTDDKIALREIWRQLGREMDLEEDDEGISKNYADTMSKLLALLSHPTETGTEKPDQVTKSVIFVLDEFELFAGHPRQTLLYNLFDIAQSRKAPIAVLGLTTKIDVAETLEKRVKSRFSHRYVYLSLSKSFQAFEQICSSALTITAPETTNDDAPPLGDSEKSRSIRGKPNTQLTPSFSQWNELAAQIMASQPCNTFLRRLYYTTKSVPDFLVSLTYAIATMPLDPSTLTTEALLYHFSTTLTHPPMQPPDSKISLLPSLSTLQLALLICTARLTNIYNTEIISFALAYEEYKGLASKAKLQASASGALAQGAGSKVWGKGVARCAWEELVECGLVMEDARAGGNGRVDVGLEEIGMCGVELGPWGRWCKEI